MSEQRTLAKKLAHVMQQVKYIQKRGKNTFHGYTYATEADVNEKVREELAAQNVIMLPSMKSHTLRETTTAKGQTEYIVCVDMDFTFIDGDSGETLTISMSGEGQDRGDKAIYKAISGAQKYALMKVFMIPTGDDPEEDASVDERNHGQQTNVKPLPSKTDPAEPGTKKVINEMVKKAGITKVEWEEILKSGNIDYAKLTREQADWLIRQLGAYTQKKEAAANA